MPKKWEQLTQSEKIEDLRRDVLMLIDALNGTRRSSEALANHIDDAKNKANAALAAVAALQARLDSGEIAERVAENLARSMRNAMPPGPVVF